MATRRSEATWLRPRDFIRTPLVSALVPVYGAERFLPDLLDDLEAQTIADRLEILVVDTASPTQEGEIIHEYQKRHPNIAYLRTEARESSCAAQNRAIAAARGKYLTLAMADDRHHPDAIARLVAELEAHPDASLVYADSAVTTQENRILEDAEIIAHFRWPDFDPRLLFEVCYVGPQPLYRRSLHTYYGLFDPSFESVCDYEMWLRLAAAGERFHHVPEILGLYLLSPNGYEHSHRERVDRESERARERHWRSEWGPRPKPGKSFLEPLAKPQRGLAGLVSPDSPGRDTPAAEPALRAVKPAGSCAAPAAGRGAARKDSLAPQSPLVSVIMPTRDRPHWLRRAALSVLCQSHSALELIVVNDGGADVSSLLEELDTEGRVVSIRLPRPRDRSAARNAGLALAHGEYVAYLDDDDWWEADHLETLVGALERSGEAVAYSNSRYVREERRGDGYALTGTVDLPGTPFDRDRLLVGNFIPILNVVHRRSCLDEAGAFDETLGTHEDWDLWLRLSRQHTFRHVPKLTGNISWRDDGSSTTSSRREDFVRTCERIHQRYAAEAATRPGVRERQAAYLTAMRERNGVAAPVDCTIVLAATSHPGETAQCLDRIARVSGDGSYEIVVVHGPNIAPDAAQAWSAEHPRVRVVNAGRTTELPALWRCGAAEARGAQIAFLSATTVPWEGWLKALLEARRSGAELAGSLLIHPDGTVSAAGLDPDAVPVQRRLAGESAANPEVRTRREGIAVSLAGALLGSADRSLLDGLPAGIDEDAAGLALAQAIARRGGRVVYEPASVLYRLHTHASVPTEITQHDPGGVSASPGTEPAQPAVAESPVNESDALRSALSAGDLATARTIVDRRLRSSPSDGQAWLMCGVVDIQSGDYEAALRAFQSAREHGAEARRALKGIGMAQLGRGCAEEAWNIFSRLVEEKPDDSEALHWLLRAGTSLQRWRALAPLLVRYLGRVPEDVSVRFALAGVRLREGRVDLARVEHDRLRRDAPEFAGLDELAAALAESEPPRMAVGER